MEGQYTQNSRMFTLISLKAFVEICQNEKLFHLSLVVTSGVIYGEDY
jgi:hypothetical protein